MLKISCTSCYGSYPATSAQFTLEMCATAKNLEKFTKNQFCGFKVINVDTSMKLVTSDCYDKQHFCAYLQPFSCKTN